MNYLTSQVRRANTNLRPTANTLRPTANTQQPTAPAPTFSTITPAAAPPAPTFSTPTTTGTGSTVGNAATTQQGQNQNNQNLVKTYQDMFERETQRAQARQAQNNAAAQLQAQQTAALAGYNPDMAAHDAFEKQAGAYNANQNIEDELAKYGVDMMEKQHQLYKDSGYDLNPETGQYTFAPDYVKDLDYDAGKRAELEKRAAAGDAYAKLALEKIAAQEWQDQQDMKKGINQMTDQEIGKFLQGASQSELNDFIKENRSSIVTGIALDDGLLTKRSKDDIVNAYKEGKNYVLIDGTLYYIQDAKYINNRPIGYGSGYNSGYKSVNGEITLLNAKTGETKTMYGIK